MELGPSLVYLLCLATSALCTVLLARAYFRSKARLLLWSAVCFGMLALNNLLVVVDLMVLTQVDLTLWRNLASLAGITALLYSFIWETD
jgi:hypothetical protein